MPRTPQVLRFECYALDLAGCCLIAGDGSDLKLRRKSFEVLRYLVENRSRVVSKDELAGAVWPGLVVTDDSVFQCIHEVRDVLADDSQRIVRTYPRRGYRFIAEVVEVDDEGTAPGTAAASATHPAALPLTPAVATTEVARSASPVPAADHAPPATARVVPAAWPAALTLAVAVVVAIAISFAASVRGERGEPDAAGLRIAVLPFATLDGTGDLHFGDGLAEDLITALSRFRDVSVVASSSSFRYRGDFNVGQAGNELAVAFVVRGSVGRDADRLRVNVQLVDTRTGATRWAERYDRPLKSLFELQDDVADQVVAKLVGHARHHAAKRIRTRQAGNLEAYELVLRAREGFNAFTPQSLSAAQTLLQRANAIDPGYAPGWDLLGRVLIRLYLLPGERQYSGQVLQQAREALQTALRLDGTIATSHGALAYTQLLQHQYEAGLAGLRHSVALNPNDAGNYRAYGEALCRVGEHRAAIEAFQRSLQLDPYSPPLILAKIARSHVMLGEYAQALAHARDCLDRDPQSPFCLLVHAVASMRAGKSEEARSSTKLLLERFPHTTIEQESRLRYRSGADQARWVDHLRVAGIPERSDRGARIPRTLDDEDGRVGAAERSP
jgi:adenylate cyclase